MFFNISNSILESIALDQSPKYLYKILVFFFNKLFDLEFLLIFF